MLPVTEVCGVYWGLEGTGSLLRVAAVQWDLLLQLSLTIEFNGKPVAWYESAVIWAMACTKLMPYSMLRKCQLEQLGWYIPIITAKVGSRILHIHVPQEDHFGKVGGGGGILCVIPLTWSCRGNRGSTSGDNWLLWESCYFCTTNNTRGDCDQPWMQCLQSRSCFN